MHHYQPSHFDKPVGLTTARIPAVKTRRRVSVNSVEKAASDARKKKIHILMRLMGESYTGSEEALWAKAKLRTAAHFEPDFFTAALQLFDQILIQQGLPPRPDGEPF